MKCSSGCCLGHCGFLCKSEGCGLKSSALVFRYTHWPVVTVLTLGKRHQRCWMMSLLSFPLFFILFIFSSLDLSDTNCKYNLFYSRYQLTQLSAHVTTKDIFNYCKELGEIVHKVGTFKAANTKLLSFCYAHQVQWNVLSYTITECWIGKDLKEEVNLINAALTVTKKARS